ncbi:MAG TPA: cupin domain-containing protein [Rhizomicrobium sp.]|nr:cupin domain-containing protein [Rhizomicrobium sp.]
MTIIDTNSLEKREKRPGWRGHIFHSQTMTFAHWDFAEGATIHRHAHEQEEVWYVIEGRIEVAFGGESHVAGPGVVAIIPPHTPHDVVALSDGKAIVADFPRREGF